MTTGEASDRIPLETVPCSARCRYRVVREDDAVHSWTASRHPGFCDGMGWDPPASLDDLRGHAGDVVDRWRRDREYAWSVEEADGGTYVGRIVVRRADAADVWDLGFWIHPERQRLGYGAEASARLLDFGFEQLDARRITAAAATWNTPSLRVLERIGMVRVGTNPHGLRKAGRWVEEAVYAIEREAWLSAAGS